MLSKVTSFALTGLDGVPVEAETDINNGIPSYELVGLPDAAVKESRERVRSALKNSGRKFPLQKITVNLAPADVRKEGSVFDLAIAVGILKATEQLAADCTGIVFLGELALDGALRSVTGILPLLISAKAAGFRKFILPAGNASEASYIEGIEVYAAKSLREVVDHLSGLAPLAPVPVGKYVSGGGACKFDLAYVKGQATAKRALEVAVSGGHNILLIGPPGTGKTMLARCIPAIMPDMTFEEALEVTKIHSVAGILGSGGIVDQRPFRTPHHTATTVSMCGGGTRALKPGEISLAHHGVLFLDELPEYHRSTLEALRQPLEDGVITVTRSGGAVRGALESGKIISVLAYGLDHVYPAVNRDLLKKIAKSGLLVSEYIPSRKSEPYLFPARNRIIAGLSEGVLVVSGGEKSGTRITARLAYEYGRDVFAFPYGIGSRTGAGCNRLIKEYAKLTEELVDITSAFGINLTEKEEIELTENEKKALCAIGETPTHISAIAEKAGLSVSSVQVCLTMLEMKKAVVSCGGNRYAAIRRP